MGKITLRIDYDVRVTTARSRNVGIDELLVNPNWKNIQVQGIPAFRDFTIRDPRYFVILF